MTAAPTTLARLSITVLSQDGETVSVSHFDPPETVSVGRSSDSDVVLLDFGTKVSRCHAVIMSESGVWEFYNLGVNGSYQNGEKVDVIKLVNGSTIRLSKNGPILVFHMLGQDDDSAAGELDEAEVSNWIRRLRDGDEVAAQQIWNRYFDQILEVAKRNLAGASSRVSDEEDVAVLALKSLLTGIKSGRFPTLDHREQLWRLLMVITSRKAAAVIEKDRRQKRGGGLVRGDSAVTKLDAADSVLKGFDSLEGHESPPDWAMLMADETHALLQLLPDDISRRLAVLKMEGHTHDEIAEKLEVNVRTVERRLKQIRELWGERMNEGSQ